MRPSRKSCELQDKPLLNVPTEHRHRRLPDPKASMEYRRSGGSTNGPKAVAFDVYRAMGGTERMRLTTMWLTHATFVVETSLWAVISLAMDREARHHPLRVVRGLWRLRRSPFTSRRAVRQLFEYHRAGFHPNDRDTSGLIGEWRSRLFGSDGELTDLLAS